MPDTPPSFRCVLIGHRKVQPGEWFIGFMGGLFKWTYDKPTQNVHYVYERIEEEVKASQA